jgi:hypothetical protein
MKLLFPIGQAYYATTKKWVAKKRTKISVAPDVTRTETAPADVKRWRASIDIFIIPRAGRIKHTAGKIQILRSLAIARKRRGSQHLLRQA